LKKHLATGLAVMLLSMIFLTGCTAEKKPSTNSQPSLPPVNIDKFGAVTAKLDFAHAIAETPLDAIKMQSPEIDLKLFRATAIRADECMTKRNLSAVASKMDWSPYLGREDRRYGLWSVDYASKYGVGLAPDAGIREFDTLPFGVIFNNAYNDCSESAKDSLRSLFEIWQAPNIDYRIETESQSRALTSTAGKRALAKWRACMEGEGIVLNPDDSRPSAQYQKRSKEAEIRVSVIEAKCGVETGAVQALYDTQARYEAAYLDAQAAQVKAFVAKRDKVERELDDVIAGR
jgi:hypothetical protein